MRMKTGQSTHHDQWIDGDHGDDYNRYMKARQRDMDTYTHAVLTCNLISIEKTNLLK